MTALPVLSRDEQIAKILQLPRPNENSVLAYYEFRLGGISKDVRLMLLPMDDHLAHRGDGVFEVIKYVGGKLYQLDEHLKRMRASAEAIYLEPPCPWEDVPGMIMAVAKAGGEKTGTIRLLLGRGPGGFGISPAECPESSLYIIATRFKPYPPEWYAKGLKGFKTSIPAKQSYLAKIKNTNYLPNVLMIREGLERGMDVPFCFSEEGYLAESAVANICLVDQSGCLEIPQFSNALPGTTVLRALELLPASQLRVTKKVTEQDVLAAREVLMLGTSPGCASVVAYEGQPIGDGKPGPTSRMVRELIFNDQARSGTPIPGLA